MSNEKYLHRDCINYAAIDVAKGICHLSKDTVQADGECCPNFKRLAKCKFCVNFTAHKEKIELGTCEASMNTPKFLAYPDMAAVTCEMYKEK